MPMYIHWSFWADESLGSVPHAERAKELKEKFHDNVRRQPMPYNNYFAH